MLRLKSKVFVRGGGGSSGGSGGFSRNLVFQKREQREKYRQSITISPLRFEKPIDSSAKYVCEPKFTV